MELVFGQLITHDNEASVIFVVMLILLPWQQSSIRVITLPGDQLSSNIIIWFLLHILSHIVKIKIT